MNPLRSTLVALCLLVLSLPCARAGEPPDFMSLLSDAADAYDQKQYQRCADILMPLDLDTVPFSNNVELILGACLAAVGRTDEALRYLDEKLPTGRIDLDDLRHKDRPGITQLRTLPGWPALMAAADRVEASMDKPLRAELLARYEKDQQWEHALIDAGADADARKAANEKLVAVMAENTAWLKPIIARQGWPLISQVGADAAQAALIIVQHSDADPDFQAQVLPLLEAAVNNHQAYAEGFAMLTDRVLVAQGKPQRYGSQLQTNTDGSMSMLPVEDEANLDARRRKLGLPSMAEYKQMLSDLYHQPVK